MSTTAGNTRDQIIDKAFQLMLQRGLNGFSYRDISEPLGVKNAAVHYHFPNKMDLIKALIDENHHTLRRSTSEFMAYGGPARPQLEGLFAFTMNQCQCGRPICMVGALSIDYDELNDDIKSANDHFMKDSVDWLTKVMEVGREQQEFSFDGEPMSKAVSILAMIQGARQLARVHGLDYLEKIFEQIRTDLGIKD
ncbi:MAG: TetR/AcrR family transcriptional regulator [Xanthomonadales bacterium]|nr:TetR/AcrR family transcriptional regulator [Gammaproteobacteria bacterium]MBT8054756.1 TetR/AcrR family transcriptional regulator [Gammaproteobacteria bacterium]NND58549.1 TetR/AcrR family transcriptional regulator [Xanthomonadales bacterium]NNK52243.1 TetR/AcrR family transcriptional regulator [Xanthomonadales bacterium]